MQTYLLYKNKNWLYLSFIFLLLICLTLINRNDIPPSKQNLSSQSDNTKIISQSALQTLINEAANEKYLMDVLNSPSKLPLPKHRLKLIPAQQEEFSTYQNAYSSISTNNNAQTNVQACNYNGQTYMAGDIARTPNGWVRCTPTFTFNQKSSEVSGYSWTIEQ